MLVAAEPTNKKRLAPHDHSCSRLESLTGQGRMITARDGARVGGTLPLSCTLEGCSQLSLFVPRRAAVGVRIR